MRKGSGKELSRMRFSCWLELLGGLATGVLGLALSIYLMKPAESPVDYLQLFRLQTCAALILTVGACAHVMRHKFWGFVLVIVGGAYLAIHSLSVVSNHHRVLVFLGWLGFFLLAPGAASVLTLAASLRNRKVMCRATSP